MNRAHGHVLAAFALGLPLLLAATEASAVEVACAEASTLEVASIEAMVVDAATAGRAETGRRDETTEIHVGVLCAPKRLLYGATVALRYGFDFLGRGPLGVPVGFGAAAFELPDPHRLADWLPLGTEADLMITGGPIALAVGEATRDDRVLATMSLGPGSVYNGLHFNPVLAFRFRPERMGLEARGR